MATDAMSMIEDGRATDAAARLARASARLRWSTLQPMARTRVADVFLDTIAVMAGGVDEPLHAGMRDVLAAGGGQGPSTVLGRRQGASVGEAIALNATLPTVLQLDEGHRSSRGHPAIHVAPVALAVGEQLGADLDDVLTAFLAGYEVSARVGVAMGGTHAAIHPHGNWGTVGAAVAAAHLYGGGDPRVIRAAIEIASGLAGQHDRRAAARGAGMHHLWASTGAHVGWLAAVAAVSGAEDVPGALVDFLLARSGLAPDARLLVADVGEEGFTSLRIEEGYVKLWAACGHTHTAIGAALEIATRPGVRAQDVVDVEVRTFRAAASLADAEARTELAARFSIPMVVAASLVDGRFDDDAVATGRLHELRPLARRVRVVHDAAADAGYPERGRPLAMRVRMRDGSAHEATGLLSPGDAERPVTASERRAKVHRLLARGLGDERARAVPEAWGALAHDADIATLSSALRGVSRRPTRD